VTDTPFGAEGVVVEVVPVSRAESALVPVPSVALTATQYCVALLRLEITQVVFVAGDGVHVLTAVPPDEAS
jgi:hypothetical protein